MESNRDESFRCLRLAKNFLQEGNKSKAEKFAQKAIRLFPSKEAEGKSDYKSLKCHLELNCEPQNY